MKWSKLYYAVLAALLINTAMVNAQIINMSSGLYRAVSGDSVFIDVYLDTNIELMQFNPTLQLVPGDQNTGLGEPSFSGLPTRRGGDGSDVKGPLWDHYSPVMNPFAFGVGTGQPGVKYNMSLSGTESTRRTSGFTSALQIKVNLPADAKAGDEWKIDLLVDTANFAQSTYRPYGDGGTHNAFDAAVDGMITVVPEPESLTLILMGLIGVLLVRRSRRASG